MKTGKSWGRFSGQRVDPGRKRDPIGDHYRTETLFRKPCSQRNSRSGNGDFVGVGWGVLSQQMESWDANPAPLSTAKQFPASHS